MVSQQGFKRLTKEYKAIKENPPPYVIAAPHEDNILLWHYVISGPPETPYEGGQYHGTLVFSLEYPFKPPAIRMTTPNGRFKENTRLCLSMSDFHPDTWNPSWSVSTILTGLLSFMTDDEQTSGSIITSDAHKRMLARSSKFFNTFENVGFRAMFPDLVKQNLENIEKFKQEEEKKDDELTKCNSFEKERVVSLEEIEDPEDRIRAEVLETQDKKECRGLKGSCNSIFSWGFFLLALILAFCCMQ